MASSTPSPRLIAVGPNLPCFVKAAVYQSGQAAGLAIKTTNPERIAELLQDPGEAHVLRDRMRQKIGEALSVQNITSGILDDEILATVEDFCTKVLEGTGTLATRKIAEGQPPQPGEDGWLEYVQNPNGLPLRELGRADQAAAKKKVYQVKAGDELVVRHPPTAGTDGCDVRGEQIKPVQEPRDVSIQTVSGPNTTATEEKLIAAIAGVYREDPQGRVHVVQEVRVEEVNFITGNLPRSGVASTNSWVTGGVRKGFGVFTSEDVFVGKNARTGNVDENTPMRARNLIVTGLVAGGRLPMEYLSAEAEGEDEALQKKLLRQIENSRIEISSLFEAREVRGRNISAGTILVRTHCHMSLLEAGEDVLVDGNLVGGSVTIGRRLQVLGDLGNAEGSSTRIRLASEAPEEKKKKRFTVEVQTLKNKMEQHTVQLETHMQAMEQRGKKSDYWAALFKGEKRPPRGPVERRILVQFFQASKQKSALERELADLKRALEDLQKAARENEEESGESEGGLSVVVGGTVYPGVTVELTGPLEAEDLQRMVARKNRRDDKSALQDVKRELADTVNVFLAPRQENLEERKEALDRMFKDRQSRPTAPVLVNKRFDVPLTFLAPEGETPQNDDKSTQLSMEGELIVYANEPQTFYLKRIWKIRLPLKNVTLSIEQNESEYTVRCLPGSQPPTPWSLDEAVLDRLDAIQAFERTARSLLFG
ncbi:MAG: FapA family protein [bacterium]|nr:FapA family protein [bacterium]